MVSNSSGSTKVLKTISKSLTKEKESMLPTWSKCVTRATSTPTANRTNAKSPNCRDNRPDGFRRHMKTTLSSDHLRNACSSRASQIFIQRIFRPNISLKYLQPERAYETGIREIPGEEDYQRSAMESRERNSLIRSVDLFVLGTTEILIGTTARHCLLVLERARSFRCVKINAKLPRDRVIVRPHTPGVGYC